MTHLRYPPELRRQPRPFDPAIEGARYGLAREVPIAIWERVCAEATDATGAADLEQAQRRFHEIAAQIAARGGRLQPDVGKRTRAVEIDGDARTVRDTAPVGDRVPGRTTLIVAEARRWRDLDAAAIQRDDQAGLTAPRQRPGADEIRHAMAALQAPLPPEQPVPGTAPRPGPAMSLLFRGATRTSLEGRVGDAASEIERSERGHSRLGWFIPLREQRGRASAMAPAGKLAAPVQADGGLDDPFGVHVAAARGVAGGGTTLPHLDRIQASFGHHDVGDVRAHVGSEAAEAAAAIGASAYATGDDVAFATTPDLRQAAHEAAHVVQQRGGVRLDGGIGVTGDAYEQHADAVAALVVQGRSAEALLDTMAHRGAGGGRAVQREDRDGDGLDDDLVVSAGMPEPLEALIAMLRASTPEHLRVTAAAFTPAALRAVRPDAIYRFTHAHAVHRVRGSGVAAVAAEAQRGAASGDGSLGGASRPSQFTYVPAESSNQAARAMLQALLAGIPAERRHDEGRILLDTLPPLANILDPAITAEAHHDLIVNPSSPWHPQSHGGIPTPYSDALWDYFKARWESEDLATRRHHLAAAHEHWHGLMAPRIFGRFVTGDAAGVRRAIRTLIDGPARHLQSNRQLDVLTHDGRALTTAELEAVRARRAAAASRPRGGGLARSETIDVAPGDVAVTAGAPRTVRYINPDAIHYVPHRPNLTPNPRHAAFDDLAAALNQLETARGDQEAIATAEADVATQVTTARERMLVYVRHSLHGAALAAAEADIPSLELTVNVEVRDYDVDVGLYRVHLAPVAPGALVERPGGFEARTTERASGRSVTGAPSEETITAALGGLTGDQAAMARTWVEIERHGEGSVTSLNTWDRTCITLGSGVSGAGPLQDQFAMFQRDDPAAYERLFGRHGIGVEARGLGATHGSGRSAFATTTAEGEQLSGRPALEHMADDPATLAVMVTAGIDPAWQQSLISGLVNSLRRGFAVAFTVAGEAVTISEGGGTTNVYDWLHGHVASNLVTCVMFAFACDFHGSSHLQGALTGGFAAHYDAAAAAPANRIDPATVGDAGRAAVATWIATDCSHPRRRQLIATAMGASSYSALVGGGVAPPP